MAHFAEIDENNLVTRIIVVDNKELLDENGNESELIGIAFCQSLFGGQWVQTSYNNNFRKAYAGIGCLYDEEKDIFISPSPYPSWKLDDEGNWQAPKERPIGEVFWNESQQSWDSL